MIVDNHYFFCGVGGSGMAPLAAILRGLGAKVDGSDRAYDQGRSAEKFDYLQSLGVRLFPQDGSGPRAGARILVASAAVEQTVPDVAAALEGGLAHVTRAALLAQLFNASPQSVGVAGTSGKSTTTAMIAWILSKAHRAPTVMNGAVMKNFIRADTPFPSAMVGEGGLFVSEVDESDGSIALYEPSVALINNIALDHKTMDELRVLFSDFAAKAGTAILNLDNDETARLAEVFAAKARTFSLENQQADYSAADIEPLRAGVAFSLRGPCGRAASLRLAAPGRHNVANALAATACAGALGVSVADCAAALGSFKGVKRRFDIIGEAGGVMVIDDFGHNPDKISATLSTLHDFPGRLLVMFQPHGFGPLRKMRAAFIETFAKRLNADDHLVMPQPVYFGGTVDRSVTSEDIAAGIRAMGRNAEAFETRDECGERLLARAKAGDRIIVMGARDDTLTDFAEGILAGLAQSAS